MSVPNGNEQFKKSISLQMGYLMPKTVRAKFTETIEALIYSTQKK